MQLIRILCATALLIFSTPIGGISLAASAEEDVKAAYGAWDAAFNKGDAAEVGAFYTEDALLLPATHDVVQGPSGIENFFKGIFDMGVTGHKLEVIQANEEGDLVYAAAKWSANGKDSDGKDQPWGGVATHIFERQDDGSLKLKLHTFN